MVREGTVKNEFVTIIDKCYLTIFYCQILLPNSIDFAVDITKVTRAISIERSNKVRIDGMNLGLLGLSKYILWTFHYNLFLRLYT